jgi:hypothetical protein
MIISWFPVATSVPGHLDVVSRFRISTGLKPGGKKSNR